MHIKRLDDLEAVADQLINDGWKEGQDSPRPVGSTYKELVAEIRRLMGQLERFKPRPIETAPKDGTPILALGVYSNNVCAVVRWVNRKRKPGWMDGLGLVPIEPTLWLSLEAFRQEKECDPSTTNEMKTGGKA